MSDEELQGRIEGGFSGNSPDERAYRIVFDALRREPQYQLPTDFASRVIKGLHPVTSSSRDMVWLGVGIVSFIIAMAVAVAKTDFRINMGVLKFISGYPGLIAFGIVFVLALHWIDKRIVRRVV